MSDTTLPLLTTWSARKAHIDSGAIKFDAKVTLCSAYGVEAGGRTTVGPVTRVKIDALPLCGLCKRRRPVVSR